MLDVVAAIAIAIMFGLALLYVSGCDRLKGIRS
jgi:hypothetical protein